MLHHFDKSGPIYNNDKKFIIIITYLLNCIMVLYVFIVLFILFCIVFDLHEIQEEVFEACKQNDTSVLKRLGAKEIIPLVNQVLYILINDYQVHYWILWMMLLI